MDKQLLLTGEYWHPDFADVLRSVAFPMLLVPMPQLLESPGGESGNSPTSPFERVRLLVVAQSRRGQYTESTMETLLRRFPGIPLVHLLGSLCEGEFRSGVVHPGWIRLYWHQWHSRFGQFLDELSNDASATWDLPRTATIADHIIRAPRRVFPRSTNSVAVCAESLTAYEMIADALDAIGFLSTWVTGEHQLDDTVSCLVVDVDSLNCGEEENLSRLIEKYPEKGVVVLMGFPRHQEVARAQQLGVSRVVSKPFELGDLKFAVEQSVNPGNGNKKSVDH